VWIHLANLLTRNGNLALINLADVQNRLRWHW
jgi:hypothetical protein